MQLKLAPIRNYKNKFPEDLISFIVILLVTFGTITAYSFKKEPIKISNIEIKQSDIKDFFVPNIDLAGYYGIKYNWKRQNNIDTTKHRILIAGDSMSGFLRLRLNDYCRKNGHTMFSLVWNSGNTVWFSETDTLDYYIKKFDPTYVLIVLGSNELFLWKPETRAKNIEKIIKKIGNRPYLWIGPPNWKEDTGINDVIFRIVGRKCYFSSEELKFTRLPDGAHPDKKSAFAWMDSIAVFMMTKAKHPIIMQKPDTTYASIPPTVILNPVYRNKKTVQKNLSAQQDNVTEDGIIMDIRNK